jgi:cell division protein FtsL
MASTATRGGAAVATRRASAARVAPRAVPARAPRSAPKPKLAPVPQPALRRPGFAAFVLIVAVALLAVVGSYAYIAQQQFQVDKLQKARITEQRKYEQLRLQVAQLTAPERIVGAAQQLGMVTPAQVTYIQITEPLPAASDPTAEILSNGWQNVKADLGKR